MSLPLPPDYLPKALQSECSVNDITLTQSKVGDLLLPTGQLVACDPFVFPETEAFSLSLPRGTFPVILSVAQMATDQRVAFATIRFRQTSTVCWEMMTVGDQDTSTLEQNESFGFAVDAGTGCFMDRSASLALDERMRLQDNFDVTMIAEMDKHYLDTWSWFEMKFSDANLIAFSSGYGDGVYATYAGFDADGELSVVVTDFNVIPLE